MCIYVVVSGCAVGQVRWDQIMSNKAKDRASFDLNCPKDQIKTKKIDMKTWGVSACKRRATYIVSGPGHCNPTTIQDWAAEEMCTMVMNTKVAPRKESM